MAGREVAVGDDLGKLRAALAGSVIGPGDPGYDDARRSFNAAIDRRPAVIARCAGASDVATAFDFARAHDLDVAVRGGGHNPAGHCVCDDGIVIDLSSMRSVEVNPEALVAHAEGGATWGGFDTATQEHGLTCDNLVGAELVTPDGSVVHAGEEENPELLWGLRGGGGNFGVATRLDFRLHRLERVLGGVLTFRGGAVREALRRFRDVSSAAPRDLSLQLGLVLDESLMPVLGVMPCYTGTDAEPQSVRTLREVPGLAEDTLRLRPFLEQQRVVDSPFGVNRNYWKGHFVRELPDELLDLLLERLGALGRQPGGVLIESLHGAPKDAPAGAAAVGFREAAFNVSAIGAWQDPALDEEHIAWARDTADAIAPWSFAGGGYVNYMQADEPVERVRAAFGAETFDRLQALKRRYDPHNVLRRNQNIPPL